MMGLFKSLGLEVAIYGLLIGLVLLYLFRLEKKSKLAGVIEEKIKNIEQAKNLNDRARRARREFGSNIQDLEEDDEAQYKKIPLGRIEDDGTTRNISGDCTEPVCLQFKGSPYHR